MCDNIQIGFFFKISIVIRRYVWRYYVSELPFLLVFIEIWVAIRYQAQNLWQNNCYLKMYGWLKFKKKKLNWNNRKWITIVVLMNIILINILDLVRDECHLNVVHWNTIVFILIYYFYVTDNIVNEQGWKILTKNISRCENG